MTRTRLELSAHGDPFNKRSVTSSHTLRAAAVLAVVVVVSVVWVVYRTVEQAQVSDRLVLHTQEVLTSLEALLATVVDADGACTRLYSLCGILPRSSRSIERNAPLGRVSISWPH